MVSRSSDHGLETSEGGSNREGIEFGSISMGVLGSQQPLFEADATPHIVLALNSSLRLLGSARLRQNRQQLNAPTTTVIQRSIRLPEQQDATMSIHSRRCRCQLSYFHEHHTLDYLAFNSRTHAHSRIDFNIARSRHFVPLRFWSMVYGPGWDAYCMQGGREG
jgi:hypothetical protein